MIGVPSAWRTAANGTHRPRWRASILGPAGDPLVEPLPVAAGQIVREEGATPRVQANVDVPATPRWGPLDQAYLPTGNRLLIEFSIEDGTGTWVPMADLDIAASALARPEDMWTIAAVDRGARVMMDDLARTGVPDLAGLTIANAISALVRRTFPGEAVHATGPATTRTVPAGYEAQRTTGSPWELAVALAEEAGAEVFYDTARRLQVRPIPVPAATVDALAVGADGVLTGYTVKHELSINTALVLYVSGDGSVLRRGAAEDRRTTSPVAVQRVGSNIAVAQEVRADAAPTQAQADAAAAAILQRQGKPRAAELRHPSRPWLEPGDSVRIQFLGGPIETQVVESVGIDLGQDNIQVTRLRNHDYQMNQEV